MRLHTKENMSCFPQRKKARVLVTHAAEKQNYQQSLSPEKKTQILCNDAGAHRK
jgi:hypothetical protein